MTEPAFLIVDLLCGGGGTSEGYEKAHKRQYKVAKVIIGVNHDPLAIATHKLNFKGVKYFIEDIRFANIEAMKKVVAYWKGKYPNAKLVLWASLDCTQHTRAKGGKPKDPDARTLAWHLDRYIEGLQPDYIKIENVREFMEWGPLDDECHPIKEAKGLFYIAWRHHVRSYGYKDEWKMLNAADYGAYTSRDRLFGCFYRPGLPMIWPKPTHAKNASNGLKKWLPVKEVLDLEDHGRTIFNRKKKNGSAKDLSENTLKRLLAGLERHVGQDFLSLYYSTGTRWASLEAPSPTVPTKDRIMLVKPQWLDKQYSGRQNHQGIEKPAGALTANPHYSLVTPLFMDKAFSGNIPSSINDPAGSVTTVDHHAIVSAQWMLKMNSLHGNQHRAPGIDEPSPTVLADPHLGLVTSFAAPAQWLLKYNSVSKKGVHVPPSLEEPSPTIVTSDQLGIVSAFLLNPQWGTQIKSIEKPCFTLIARMDKAPPYLVVTEHGEIAIPVYKTDSPMTVKIKEFMAEHNIIDIKIRMLKVDELKLIQGFPLTYKMAGSPKVQKKHIGNAVHSDVPAAWAREFYTLLTA